LKIWLVTHSAQDNFLFGIFWNLFIQLLISIFHLAAYKFALKGFFNFFTELFRVRMIQTRYRSSSWRNRNSTLSSSSSWIAQSSNTHSSQKFNSAINTLKEALISKNEYSLHQSFERMNITNVNFIRIRQNQSFDKDPN
jgi:hypothetical protein